MTEIITTINDYFWTYILIALLLGGAIWFTIRTKGVQFRMIPEMIRLLLESSKKDETHLKHETEAMKTKTVSSFQAFTVSIAGRVGTGNLAGVATAIAIGGPGAVFWMWVVALLGSSLAFVESTLAQLYKEHGENSFYGGPAYYLLKGLKSRWMAITFAVLITLTFTFAFSTVQANQVAAATQLSFGWKPMWLGLGMAIAAFIIVMGGIQRISKFSEIVVPLMAVGYILLAIVVICMNIALIPDVLWLIVRDAFTGDAAIGGTMGTAIMMGVRRGLFSNEAGEGSAPNVAATAAVSHPVKQGLIQALSVFTDTLLVCTATACIILWSGLYDNHLGGVELTQQALESEIGSWSAAFIAIAIFFFGFTTIITNYFYGETNLRFIRDNKVLIFLLRVFLAFVVFFGSMVTMDLAWGLADLFMGCMVLINVIGILLLGKYAFRCLDDYCRQKKLGKDPVYYSSTIPEIQEDTKCWPKDPADKAFLTKELEGIE